MDNIHSVASFFVSRVDTEVDKRLEERGNTELQGRAGLANARAAYQLFLRYFHGDAFKKLADAGAPVQRPLWASTGVKNPKYPDDALRRRPRGAGDRQHDAGRHARRRARASRPPGATRSRSTRATS